MDGRRSDTDKTEYSFPGLSRNSSGVTLATEETKRHFLQNIPSVPQFYRQSCQLPSKESYDYDDFNRYRSCPPCTRIVAYAPIKHQTLWRRVKIFIKHIL